MDWSTLDSSDDDSSEKEDCGIHEYIGEPSCKCGALGKLDTTVKTVGIRVDWHSATTESDGLVFD